MKIQLQSLRVINCGPLDDVCIHFNTNGESPTTVLAGANGSGKTTALELIVGLAELLLPVSELPPLRPILLRTQYAQVDWLVDGKPFSLFYGDKPIDLALAGDYLSRSQIVGGMSDEMKGDLAKTLREQIFQQEAYGEIDPFDNVSKSGKGVPNFNLPSILFFPNTRSLLPVTGEQINKEAVDYRWVYYYQVVSQFKGSLDSYLVWLDYVQPANFIDVLKFLDDIDINGKTFSIRRKDLKVVVTTPGDGIHFVEDMSSGEQNVLILLLELRRRLLPHSIVLIDEIESSLHRAFQQKLAQALKRMQEQIPFQLIVTTHSIPIVESFGPASVRILTEF